MKKTVLSKRVKSSSLVQRCAMKHLMLRARVRKSDGDLIPLLKRAAEILQLDEADVIRIGSRQYAASVVYRTPIQQTLKLDA